MFSTQLALFYTAVNRAESCLAKESVGLRINLLRNSHFGQIFLSISSNMNNYSPQSIEKSHSKWLFLATIT